MAGYSPQPHNVATRNVAKSFPRCEDTTSALGPNKASQRTAAQQNPTSIQRGSKPVTFYALSVATSLESCKNRSGTWGKIVVVHGGTHVSENGEFNPILGRKIMAVISLGAYRHLNHGRATAPYRHLNHALPPFEPRYYRHLNHALPPFEPRYYRHLNHALPPFEPRFELRTLGFAGILSQPFWSTDIAFYCFVFYCNGLKTKGKIESKRKVAKS